MESKVAKASFYSLNFADLDEFSRQKSLGRNVPRHLFNWHYKKHHREPCSWQTISRWDKEAIYSHFDFSLPRISSLQESPDKTVKFQVQFADFSKVEVVLIPFQKKYTVCLSSQVGCAMNCSFCFTGKQGFSRHLTTAEIVTQLLIVQDWLIRNRPLESAISNLVFMGQGEPLHNFESVKKACEIFVSQYGLSIAYHKITVSTAGYLPGLRRWSSEMPEVNLALSLHAIDEEKRSQLIPINKKFPLREVFQELEKIPLKKKRFITFEYLLLEGFNNSQDEAHKLGSTLMPFRALVNLIPFNPFPGSSYRKPALESIKGFAQTVESYGHPTMIRTTKGDEILAACGQLNLQSH
jgi:23S rRNA (adenine2503-C2)-methyltransferase